MKIALTACGLLLVVAAGCQKPDPVVVDQDESTERQVEVTPIAPPDTDQTLTSVDTTGVTPHDAATFAAFVLVCNVEYDAGPLLRHTDAFSTVYFADPDNPLRFNGKTLGFFGLDLSPAIVINGLPMLRFPHRLRVPGVLRDTAFGFVYLKDLAGVHQPNTLFTWSVPLSAALGPFSTSIMSPDNVQVLAPAGGTVISRDQDLLLRWAGKGNLDIVISVLNPLTKRTRPIMKLHPRVNTGKAIIDKRILQLLPRERFFVLTFIIANRHERLALTPYRGLILVQAASVYNSYVEFQ